MEKVNVGIVGLGKSGWNIHAKALNSQLDKYCVVAVCDPDEGRRKEAQAKYTCRTYKDITSMLKDQEMDWVIVAPPSKFHCPYTIQALKAGKNVICEKPMAAKLSDAIKMVKTAEKEKKYLAVFHNRRYQPDFLKVREIIDSGKIGKVLLIKMSWNGFARRWDWQTLRECGGGTLNNTGPHPIDHGLHLLGEGEPEVFCQMVHTPLSLGDAEDHVKVILRTKKGPVVDIEISSACAYPQDHWLVMGTQGGIRGNMKELYWKYIDPSKLSKRKATTVPSPDRSYNYDPLTWENEESWKATEDVFPYASGMFYKDLYDRILKGKPPAITPESALRVMRVIEKCHKMSGI